MTVALRIGDEDLTIALHEVSLPMACRCRPWRFESGPLSTVPDVTLTVCGNPPDSSASRPESSRNVADHLATSMTQHRRSSGAARSRDLTVLTGVDWSDPGDASRVLAIRGALQSADPGISVHWP
jgi:hypothetical protein